MMSIYEILKERERKWYSNIDLSEHGDRKRVGQAAKDDSVVGRQSPVILVYCYHFKELVWHVKFAPLRDRANKLHMAHHSLIKGDMEREDADLTLNLLIAKIC